MPFIYLGFGFLFCWALFRAITKGEISGRGWGGGSRSYSRVQQPVWFWITFSSYGLAAIISFMGAIRLLLKSP